jgi:Na+/proline symporter
MVNNTLWLLLGLGVTFIAFTIFKFWGRRMDSQEFLVAGRNVGFWSGMLSILATWAGPPAILLSAQFAYTMGFLGAFWFTVPNALALMAVGWLAVRLRDKVPDGVTINEVFGRKNHSLYAVVSSLVLLRALVGLIMMVVGGSALLALLSPLNVVMSAIIILVVILSYSLISGLEASIFTDVLQIILILTLLAIFVPWTFAQLPNPSLLITGIDGKLLTLSSLAFIILLIVNMFTGTFVNQPLWQRAYAIKRDVVKRSFIIAGAIFVFIPLSMALLGLYASSAGIIVNNPLLAGVAVMEQALPAAAATIVFALLLGALLSSADSALIAGSTILAVDFGKHLFRRREDPVKLTRIFMILLAMLVALAAVSPFSFVDWFFFNAAVGATLLFPIIIYICSEKQYSSKATLASIVMSTIIGIPLYIIATLQNNPWLQVAAIGASFALSVLFVFFRKTGTARVATLPKA